jgi:hypothetical protein
VKRVTVGNLCVQLGWWEVDARVLEGSGDLLDSVLEAHGIGETLDPDRVLASMPRAGWRDLKPQDSGRNSLILASRSGDGWVMLQLDQRDGAWFIAGDPTPRQPIPCKAERASLLTLSWPSETLEAESGRKPKLIASLTNHGSEPFPRYEVDNLHAVGWILDSDTEQPVAYEEWVTYSSSSSPNASCPPGGTIDIEIHLLTKAPEQLPAGSYKLKATLTSLSLHTPVANLTLRA